MDQPKARALDLVLPRLTPQLERRFDGLVHARGSAGESARLHAAHRGARDAALQAKLWEGLWKGLSGSYRFTTKPEEAVAGFRASIKEGVAFTKTNTDDAKKTQITYLGLPAEVVASLPLATFAPDVDEKQVSFWVGLCKEFELCKTDLKTDALVLK